MRRDCFAFKVKDQALQVNGRYRKNPYAINGVADICVFLDSSTMWLEVKTEKGRQSESQKEFQARVERWRGLYHVVRSIDDVREILKGEVRRGGRVD